MSCQPNSWSWLTARPIAHRGLHSKSQKIVENSLAAAAAAIAGNFAIECDVQATKDGEAVVFHDDDLSRLTPFSGNPGDYTASEVTRIGYRDGNGLIPTFDALLAAVAGRVPLIVEIKSRFDGDLRLTQRVADLTREYAGPLALKSFDPELLVHFRSCALARPLGLVAQATYEEAEWAGLTRDRRNELATFADYERAKPDFLSWNVADLPHAVATLWRHGLGLPLLTWTVRTSSQAAIAARFADQMIFEDCDAEPGFRTTGLTPPR
jgi:glycerophosphoryl diester phosphodiesterase